jgi:hypothetical protein
MEDNVLQQFASRTFVMHKFAQILGILVIGVFCCCCCCTVAGLHFVSIVPLCAMCHTTPLMKNALHPFALKHVRCFLLDVPECGLQAERDSLQHAASVSSTSQLARTATAAMEHKPAMHDMDSSGAAVGDLAAATSAPVSLFNDGGLEGLAHENRVGTWQQGCSTYLRNVWGPPEILPGHHFAPRKDATSRRKRFRDLPEGSQDLVNLAKADCARLATFLLHDCFTVSFF